jgi:hypothetical protein
MVALARSSLPLASCRVLSMFSVYFDESGTHKDSNVVVVAGWVSTDIQWQRFSTAWTGVLRAAGLDPPIFHMTDYESRRGQFAGWQQNKRVRVLQKLQGLIRRRTKQAIVAAVIVDAFAKGRRERKVPSNMSPYGFGVVECIKKVGQWADNAGYTGPIAYYFEDGNRWRSHVLIATAEIERTPDFRARYRFASWGFGFKDTMTPLQAADMLAYEIWKEAINGNLVTGDGRLRPMRKSLRAMVDMVPRFSYYGAHAFDSAPELPSRKRLDVN